MLDYPEFARWLEASDDEARVARELVEVKAFNAVVLHSEQAARLLLKGLLRGVGAGKEAWGHALSELAERAVAVAELELQEGLQERLTVLERDYMPTRYPDALVSGTPLGNYAQADADRALETLTRLRDVVVATWERLVDNETDTDPPGDVEGDEA
jgi:HEPN domain-containing protein